MTSSDHTHDFTTISFARDIPGFTERRLELRHLAVLQVGKLIGRDRQMLCLVKNVSSGGVKIHAPIDLAPGEAIAVEVRPDQRIAGKVIWAEEMSAGIQFDTPIDVLDVLIAAGADVTGPFLPRSPRLEVEASATATFAGTGHRVELFDVSQSGVCLAAIPGCPPGARLSVEIDGLPERSGIVCQSSDGRAGIGFNLALPYDVLNRWALDHKPRLTLDDIR